MVNIINAIEGINRDQWTKLAQENGTNGMRHLKAAAIPAMKMVIG